MKKIRIFQCAIGLCVALVALVLQEKIVEAGPPQCYPQAPCQHCKNCYVNPKFYGYHPTKWRRWPGTEKKSEQAEQRQNGLPILPKSDTPVSDSSRFDAPPKAPATNTLPKLQPQQPELPKQPSNELPPPVIKKPATGAPQLPPPVKIDPNDLRKNPFKNEQSYRNSPRKRIHKTNSVRTASAELKPNKLNIELSLHETKVQRKPTRSIKRTSNPQQNSEFNFSPSSGNPLR